MPQNGKNLLSMTQVFSKYDKMCLTYVCWYAFHFLILKKCEGGFFGEFAAKIKRRHPFASGGTLLA